MNRLTKFALILAGSTFLNPQAALAKGVDAKLWNGAWHLNAAKSKFGSPGKEASETRTYTVSSNRISMKSSSKDPAGKTLEFSYDASLDGKWSPMRGNPNGDSISVTPVSAGEIKASTRLHGKSTVESSARVTSDEKHLTLTRKMVAMKGAPTDVLEFDR
jgi:hypothetical protein